LFNLGQAILNYCSSLKQHALPPLCLVCSDRATLSNLCDGCRNELPYLPVDRCPTCAAPSHASQTCGRCLSAPPAFDRVAAPCAYGFPLDRLIHSFKYSGNLAVGPLLSELLLQAVSIVPKPDVVIPMPLSAERLRERGFNQSLEIARLISQRTGTALEARACLRVRHAPAQSVLPWPERRRNVRGAFVCLADLTGQSVAVVDDVLTTGAT
jgi:ComF family protein